MAEFGASQTEAPQVPNAITPTEGIVKEPVGLQAVANIFGNVRDIRKSERKGKGDAFLADFTNKQLALVQAVDQGMDSQAARTRMRNNLAKAVSDFPGLREDILKASNSILGKAGMGDVVTTGDVNEVRNRQLENKMFEIGLIGSEDTREEVEIKKENYRMTMVAEQRLKQEADLISLERARVGLTKDQTALLDAREERAAKEFLTSTTPAMFDQFRTTANNLISLIGQEGYDEASVIAQIEARFNSFEQDMSGHLANVDSTTGGAYMKSFREFKDLAIKRAQGDYTQAAWEREIKRIGSQQQVVALGDRVLARAYALSQLGLNDMLIPEQLNISSAAARFLTSNLEAESEPANLFVNTKEGRDSLNAYLKVISVDPSKQTEEQRAEQTLHLTRIFEGIETYEGVINKDPEKGVQLITEWMSTPEFFRLSQANPGVVENSQVARDIVQGNYADQVWGMVDREFRENNIISIPSAAERGSLREEGQLPFTTQPTPDAVGQRATNNGMEFYPINKDDNRAVARAKELNKTLGPVINKSIKAFSHLEGNTNYRQFWENNQERFMEGQVNDDFEGSQGNDPISDLTLEDFKQGLGTTEALPLDEVNDIRGLGRGRGFTTTPKMDSVEGMIIHHTGGRGTAEDVVRILDERDLSVQFVIDREGVVHQLMDDNQSAWHAGKNNQSGFDNNNTVGVEIIGKDDKDILPIQVQAAQRLIKAMSNKHGFDLDNVFGHGEVATHKRPTEGKSVLTALRGNRGGTS